MTGPKVSFWEFLLVAVPLFAFVWCTVSFIISRFGWRRFAARYRATERPEGCAYNVAFFSFGSLHTSYRNAARVIFTHRGIYFRMLFLFRPFHPPFLVPWSSVTSVHPLLGLMNSNYYEITIDDQVGKIRLHVHKKVEKDLIAYHKVN